MRLGRAILEDNLEPPVKSSPVVLSVGGPMVVVVGAVAVVVSVARGGRRGRIGIVIVIACPGLCIVVQLGGIVPVVVMTASTIPVSAPGATTTPGIPVVVSTPASSGR